ncbi:MAG: hypothetical protein A3E07_00510 [Candidatus Wildermuthbacteria bacterium RIFCSPHIGHO2_12_FULL_45_9]|uniref:Uncharacterized protein n=1 Tax=Candidatus Wildermuthbacteria bacterium RIFCSPHIGHO2_02_FULL_45_25 TaxID=1802450 RepID=A0A1G2R4E2_9BACT|nr:MAG: hypothetical protein A2748_00675 [Candidatus Wildermuthbacteria bacterium RIFCSPHIGHO2_01_FULL_45_20]OHA67693.1 MAG: hypothetical protein A3C04_02135 [Candidatus Wildermuthbacteria bacterium RIFCSPHIGHO2_02_FULL_45_25]OHA70767.1 MAG: hypothetical protein A3E07_00510 [Candidatus Wildermuthbacteria bacterium RIFCSPHIGHO2_12_FULL_45_9]
MLKEKNFFVAAGIIFTAIFAIHGARSLLQWQAWVQGWEVPLWLSWAAGALAAFMAVESFRHLRKVKK